MLGLWLYVIYDYFWTLSSQGSVKDIPCHSASVYGGQNKVKASHVVSSFPCDFFFLVNKGHPI